MTTVRGAGLEGIGRVRSSTRNEDQNEYVATREAYLKQLQKKHGIGRSQALEMLGRTGGVDDVRAGLAEHEETEEEKRKREKEEAAKNTLRGLAAQQRARQAAAGV